MVYAGDDVYFLSLCTIFLAWLAARARSCKLDFRGAGLLDDLCIYGPSSQHGHMVGELCLSYISAKAMAYWSSISCFTRALDRLDRHEQGRKEHDHLLRPLYNLLYV